MNEIKARKQYRTVGLTVFIISIMLLVFRIISYYVNIALIDVTMSAAAKEIIMDVVFSVPVQVLLLLLFPLLMYKLVLKQDRKELMNFSGYRRVSPKICILSFLLGICALGLSFFFSVMWQLFLMAFGYTPSGGSDMPLTFNVGYFLLTVLLTAVLPGICEEFTNRGGFLTTMRGSYSEIRTILIIAIAFGLFHQNITQILYTAIIGALLAFLALRTGSVLPAIIVHFTNNFISLCLDNIEEYALGGAFFDFLSSSLAVFTAFAALCLIGAFLLVLAILKIAKKSGKRDYYGEYHELITRTGFKPTLKDNAFLFGALTVTVISTVITFAFGL